MVGLGSTAQKLQTVAEKAEKVYKRMNELREEVEETQQSVEETNSRVGTVEEELAEQRAVLDAIAEKHDIDVEAVAAEVHINEAENGADEGADEGTEEEAATGGD
ncbi:hypothetical protein JCM30237_05660 [Halolamina litorea]|uniref:DUF5798 family protein n=1 Tax=Halolamina litorea TaxID=1515593 RepID=A0ABD6BPE0_9EURY|nr:DUF5798 family protein [Halolamina litorea]